MYTLTVNQLSSHISLDVLPRRLGGKCHISHRNWMYTCLERFGCEHSNSEHPNSEHPMCSHDNNITDNIGHTHDVTTFFDSWDTEDALDASITSSSMNSSTFTADNDDTCYMNSSEMSASSSEDEQTQRTTTYKRATSTLSVNSLSNSDDVPYKRPATDHDHALLGDLSSVQSPEIPGISINGFMEMVRQKGRQKLYDEYQCIKSEPPTGMFEVSR